MIQNHILDALKTLENIPSPFFRGRGGSMLFSAISLLGYSKVLYTHGRDYIAETLDYLDNADTIGINPSFPQSMSPAFVNVYPLLTMLNAIASTGHTELLNYRQDRIRQANHLGRKQRLGDDDLRQRRQADIGILHGLEHAPAGV